MNEIQITLNHSGKMKGMQSLSTNTLTNSLCTKNHQIEGSICAKCYSQTLLKMRKTLQAKTERNTILLTKRILKFEELPYVNTLYFRFEAFGDVHNRTHLINYMNMAIKNPHCRFALFTKNYKVAYEYFQHNPIPTNVNIILSSLMINKPISVDKFIKAGIKVKTFTVYRKEAVAQNNIEINCGAKSCISCLNCYTKNDIIDIRELLKSDQKKGES